MPCLSVARQSLDRFWEMEINRAPASRRTPKIFCSLALNAAVTTSKGVSATLVRAGDGTNASGCTYWLSRFESGDQSLLLSCHLFCSFCDECWWNYIPGSRCGFDSRRCWKTAPWFNGQNTSALFHRPLSSHLFPRLGGTAANATGTTSCRGFEPRQPQGCSSVGRANVPVPLSLPAGPACTD